MLVLLVPVFLVLLGVVFNIIGGGFYRIKARRILKKLTFEQDFNFLRKTRCGISGLFEGEKFNIFFRTLKSGGGTLPCLVIESRLPVDLGQHITIDNHNMGMKTNERDIVFNDPAFDKPAIVSGPVKSSAMAVISPAVRIIFKAHFFNGDFVRLNIYSDIYNTSTVLISYRFSFGCSAAEIKEWLTYSKKLAEALNRRCSYTEMLRENFLAEPDPLVKLEYFRALRIVQTVWQDNDPIVYHSLSSKNASLMLFTVETIGRPGWKHIPEIYSIADDDEKIKLLKYAARRVPETMCDFFTGLLSADNPAEYNSLILVYLKRLGYIKSEEKLMKFLADPGSRQKDLFAEGVGILAKCGTIKAVSFLAERRNFLNARIIDQAIAEIHSRTETGDAGWVSLDQPGAGEGLLSRENDN